MGWNLDEMDLRVPERRKYVEERGLYYDYAAKTDSEEGQELKIM